MKKLYESPLNGSDETAESVTVYAIESDDEFWKLDDMTHDERLEALGLCEDVNPMLGATGTSYDFELSPYHVIVTEKKTLNV